MADMDEKTLFITDMPDPDVIRVDDTYYMISTTMFFMPGAPVLCSKDLRHWKLLSYVFTTIEDNENYRLENGKHAYGKGQWATSLAYRKGRFYACFVCHDMGKTFIYSTDDPAKTGWDRVVIDEAFHDMSFLFWEDRAFLVYDNGDIKIVELEPDLSGVKKDGLRKLLFKAPEEGMRLRCEGCRALVKDNRIYLLFIEWPKGGIRREVCYRSASLDGPYERRVIFEETCGRAGCGVAQGTLVEDVRGNWYAMLFQDRGASGRIPYLFSVDWEDGWPVIHREPIIPEAGEKQQKETGLFAHSFLDEAGKLHKAWQWNHNPLEGCYTLDAASGALRLTTGHLATGLLDARNTMTCRTAEPGCSFAVKLDFGGLKRGDYAGICAFQGKYGQIGVKITRNGPVLLLKQKQGESYGVGKIVPDAESRFDCWTKTLNNENTIYLRIDYAFGPDKDLAYFCYSFDGESWENLGDPLQMRFTLDMFTGYRTGIFCYATEETGGFADYSMVLK